MKNKNLALVAVLFTISVIMAFANGPTPQVVIDTDQIVDGAVTAIKTDGTLMLSDGSNASDAAAVRGNLGLGTISTKAATDYVATSALALRLDTTNASISENLDVAGNVGAATVNGVAPLTDAEKTQALVGSSTVSHAAKGYAAAINGLYTQYVDAAFGSAGISAGTTYTSSIFVYGDSSILVSIAAQNGVNTSLGEYLAIVSRFGTGSASVEIEDTGNNFSLAVDSNNYLVVTNTSATKLFSNIRAWRLR